MRLTLRTLLAYLDDTLEATEIAEIGQKVAESDKAQELISRIKQVTRRRRLTTPPMSGPGAFDPNDVSEYLDNVLPSEKLKDLEQLAQESDVHLAEIAASHQILTLVQGEPALVPPTAKRRFFDLVKGKESDNRKAVKPTRPAEKTPVLSGDPDADETLLLGLPVYQKAPWLRWALPVGAACVLVLMGVLLYISIPKRSTERGTEVALVPTSSSTTEKHPEKDKDKDKDRKDKDKTVDVPDRPAPDKGAVLTDKDKDKDKDKVKDKDKEPSKDKFQPMPEPMKDPKKERREVGKFVSPKQILALKPEKADRWVRVAPEAAIFTNEPLVSLPGYQSDVRLSSGVEVKLYGCLQQLVAWAPSSATEVNIPPAESAVMFHVPESDFDAELTLERGRIYLTNLKDKPAKVRVRFAGDEIYDITLVEPKTSVALQLGSEFHVIYSARAEDSPLIELDLFVEKGEVEVKHRTFTYGLMKHDSRNRLVWSNKRGLQKQPDTSIDPPEFGTKPINPKTEKEFRAPLDELAMRLAKNDGIEAALRSSVDENRQWESDLSVRCLGAINATDVLYDILNDPKVNMGLRHQAIFSLRRYVNRGQSEMKSLYDPKEKSGVFVKKQLAATDAENMVEMLRTFYVDGARVKEVLETLILLLKHDKLPVRELAYWHLKLLVGEQGINYDAAAEKGMRDLKADMWKGLITAGKLPLKM